MPLTVSITTPNYSRFIGCPRINRPPSSVTSYKIKVIQQKQKQDWLLFVKGNNRIGLLSGKSVIDYFEQIPVIPDVNFTNKWQFFNENVMSNKSNSKCKVNFSHASVFFKKKMNSFLIEATLTSETFISIAPESKTLLSTCHRKFVKQLITLYSQLYYTKYSRCDVFYHKESKWTQKKEGWFMHHVYVVKLKYQVKWVYTTFTIRDICKPCNGIG